MVRQIVVIWVIHQISIYLYQIFRYLIIPGLPTETYTGLTSRTFKQRYYGHTSSFNHRDSTSSTTLSSYLCWLKDQDRNFNLSWSIIDRGMAYHQISIYLYQIFRYLNIPGLPTETHTGLTSRTFKQRYYGHTSSFNHRDSTSSTTLSSYSCGLKDQDRNFNLSWSIIDRGKAFNPVTRRCNLSTKEKFHLIFQPEGASLNKRSEMFSTCRHRKKNLLSNLDQ